MAAVVSATVAEDRAQVGGRRNLRYRIVLQDSRGDTHTHDLDKLYVDPGFDAVADVAAAATALLADRASQEDRASPGLATEGGDDALALVQTPRWSTSKRIAKRIMRHAFREKDPRVVITLEPLINYLRANFNRAQLANFLDMTVAQIDAINDKIDTVLSAPTLPASLKSLLADVESKSQDLED